MSSRIALLTALALLLVTISTGCAGGDPAATDPTSTEPSKTKTDTGQRDAVVAAVGAEKDVLTLRLDEAVQHKDLALRWLEIEDSRCPTGVTCVWAGQMQATLEVGTTGGVAQTVTLLRRALREPEAIEVLGYTLRLLGVDPHPQENTSYERSQYRMQLEVSS